MHQLNYNTDVSRMDLDRLCEASVFGAMSAEAIEFLLINGRIISLQAAETLFDYGEKGSNFFVVLEGNMDFYKYCDSGYSRTRSIGFGEEVGFVAMISLNTHTGKAVAREPSLALEISSSLFADLHQILPNDFGLMLLNLTRDFARAIRTLSDKLAGLSSRLPGESATI